MSDAALEKAQAFIAADVRLISGCEDAQTSADVSSIETFKLPDPAGLAGGACTSGMLQVLYSDHQDKSKELSFEQVLLKLRENLSSSGLSQIPQLSSSRPMDMKQMFHIVPEDKQEGTRRAVMIGINYTGQDGELSGCQNDVQNMMEYLKNVHGFQDENISLLLDDGEHTKPTRTNITKAFKEVAKLSEPGDVVFCHFSGHGGKIKDFDGDEDDGWDETLIPVDWDKGGGQIRDDYLFEKLVCPLKEGVTMTCVFDCCHSGTVLDLPYVFKGDGKQEDMNVPDNFDFGKIEQAAETSPEVEVENPPVVEESSEVSDEGDAEEQTPYQENANPPPPKQEAADEDSPEETPGDTTEVYVRYGGVHHTVKAKLDENIIEIKKELEKLTGIPVAKQRLIYNSFKNPFKDDQTLRYYRCLKGPNFTLTEQ